MSKKSIHYILMEGLDVNTHVDISVGKHPHRDIGEYDRIRLEIARCMGRDMELSETKGQKYSERPEEDKAFDKNRLSMMITTAHDLGELKERERKALVEFLEEMEKEPDPPDSVEVTEQNGVLV